jgi:hypothetical protein
MKLGAFLKEFIEPNSLVRLVYKTDGGHKIVLDSWSSVTMEWEILKGKGENRHYVDNEVLGIASIWMSCNNFEAINIVIEELKDQPYVDEIIDEKNNCQCGCNQ